MREIKVSVIIPTFNRAQFIKSTIDSVLVQTFKDFEIIIIDDGSTDNTRKIITSLNDSRIKYYNITHSGIPSIARNFGIKVSCGQYIAFLDSDDLWFPNKLERSIKHFHSPHNIGIVTSKEIFIDNDNNELGRTTCSNIHHNKIINFEELYYSNIVSTSAAIILRECVDKIGFFDESPFFRTVEDHHYWWRIAAKYNVYFLNDVLGYYRWHDTNISKNIEENLINRYNSILDISQKYNDIIFSFKKSPVGLFKNLQKSILKMYIRQKNFKKTTIWFFNFIKPFNITDSKMVAIK